MTTTHARCINCGLIFFLRLSVNNSQNREIKTTMILLLFSQISHVPIYCERECCDLRHEPDVSQAVYFRSSGGVVVDLTELGDEDLQIDVVFKDEVDPALFDLYVGCGSCAAGTRRVPAAYADAVFEPFTQTLYRSVLDNRTIKREFLDACTNNSFQILVQTHNETRFAWSAVVGLKEKFTVLEILLFPVFILRNHAEWNDVAFSFWILLGLGLVEIATWRVYKERRNLQMASAHKRVQIVFYHLAAVGYGVALLECVIHAFIAHAPIPATRELYFGFLLVVVVNGLPIALVLFAWIRTRRGLADGRRRAYAELGVALVSLFAFGSGFFIGPFGLALAASVEFGSGATPAPHPPDTAVIVTIPKTRTQRPSPSSASLGFLKK